MSMSAVGAPVGVSQENASHPDHAKFVLLNLSYPSRSASDAGWVYPSKPLVIQPTTSTRYETAFIYTNTASGPVGHQSTPSGGVFDEYSAVRWLKRAFSRHMRRLRRKIRLAKANLTVTSLLRRRGH